MSLISKEKRVLQYEPEAFITKALPTALESCIPFSKRIIITPTKSLDNFLEFLIKTRGIGLDAVVMGITNPNPDPEDNPELYETMAYFSMGFKSPAIIFANVDPKLNYTHSFVPRKNGPYSLANALRHILKLPDKSLLQ